MMDTNLVVQIGNLVVTPELRQTKSGAAVTNLLIANSHTYTDAAGKTVRQSTKLNVAVFGRLAEYCVKSLAAGSLVVVEGRLENRERPAKDGTLYHTLEIVDERVGFGPNPRDVEYVDE